MAEAILMPRLSDTMTEGVIAAWHKKVGDSVKKGELLAEIETDKATMELESYKDGTLLHIGTDKGGKLQVNDLLAVIGQPGEDISGILKGKASGDKAQGTSGGKGQGPSDLPTGQAGKTQGISAKAQGTSGKTQAAGDKGGKPTTSNEQPATSTQPATNKIDITQMEEVVLMPRLSDCLLYTSDAADERSSV